MKRGWVMQERRVDVAIIGAGSAGLNARRQVEKVTQNYVLIQGGSHGTTCARVGCMPSKLFIQSASDFHRRTQFAELGLEQGDRLLVDLKKVMRRVQKERDLFAGGVIKGMQSFSDKIINGYARFVEPYVLDVEGQIIRAKRIIIATGSQPVIPSKWKKLSKNIISTDEFFEQTDLPKKMAVIGAGIVGLEIGQAISRLGIDNIIIEAQDYIGGITDPEINAEAISLIRQECDLQLLSPADLGSCNDQISVEFAQKDCKKDLVLVALGRKPAVDGLSLETLSIPLNASGLPDFNPLTMKVDGYDIYMAGDVQGEKPLMHEASDEGNIAGYNAVHEKTQSFVRKTNLTIVFSDPQIALVGKTYKQLQDQNPIIGEVDFSSQSRAIIMLKNKGKLRVYADRYTAKLLGAEMIVPHAEHIAHLLAWVIQQGLTLEEILSLPFYHPVIEEGLRGALRDALSQYSGHKQALELLMV